MIVRRLSLGREVEAADPRLDSIFAKPDKQERRRNKWNEGEHDDRSIKIEYVQRKSD